MNHLEKYENLAKNSIPAWSQLPPADPMKILGEFVSRIADSFEKRLEELPHLVARELPGVFGIQERPGRAAQGWVQIQMADGFTEEIVLPANTVFTAESRMGTTHFQTLEAYPLFQTGDLQLVQSESEILIGLEQVPLLSPLQLFMVPEREGREISCTMEWSILRKGGWFPVSTQDQTESLRRAGMIKFFTSELFQDTFNLHGTQRYWVRGRAVQGQLPSTRSVHANVVLVSNERTIAELSIGSGSGLPHQSFALPSGELVRPFSLEVFNGETREWEQWEEVQTFFLSEAHSKHFKYEGKTHTVQFGDGRNGKRLSPGYDNVVVKNLSLCDGLNGNLPKNSILQLRNEDWRIASVSFFADCFGGANRALDDDLLKEMHSSFRNKDRAITLKDYEEMGTHSSSRIGKVFASFQNEDSTVNAVVILRPEFSSEASHLDYSPLDGDLKTVEANLAERKTLNTALKVSAPSYRLITIRGKVFVRGLNEERSRLLNEHLLSFFCPFKNSKVMPSASLSRDEFFRHIEASEFVRAHRQIEIIDELSGLSLLTLELKPNELPKIYLEVTIEELLS